MIYLNLLWNEYFLVFVSPFDECFPAQDLRSFDITSSTSTEQSSKAAHLHQLVGSFLQEMQTAFRNFSLLDILGSTSSSHMEEPTTVTVAKVWCFVDSDIDRVSTGYFLGNNAPSQATTRTQHLLVIMLELGTRLNGSSTSQEEPSTQKPQCLRLEQAIYRIGQAL